MVEKGIRGGICHVIYGYVKANNKYIKNGDKNGDSLYGWEMSQNLTLGGVK